MLNNKELAAMKLSEDALDEIVGGTGGQAAEQKLKKINGAVYCFCGTDQELERIRITRGFGTIETYQCPGCSRQYEKTSYGGNATWSFADSGLEIQVG